MTTPRRASRKRLAAWVPWLHSISRPSDVSRGLGITIQERPHDTDVQKALTRRGFHPSPPVQTADATVVFAAIVRQDDGVRSSRPPASASPSHRCRSRSARADAPGQKTHGSAVFGERAIR